MRGLGMEGGAETTAEQNVLKPSGGVSPDDTQESPIRGEWLVGMSVFLAVFLEVIPVEADVVSVLVYSGSLFRALLAKLLFLILILFPLVICVRLNGLRGLTSKITRGRVILVVAIVVIHLAFDCWMVWGQLMMMRGHSDGSG
jgi:hypothetical protein